MRLWTRLVQLLPLTASPAQSHMLVGQAVLTSRPMALIAQVAAAASAAGGGSRGRYMVDPHQAPQQTPHPHTPTTPHIPHKHPPTHPTCTTPLPHFHVPAYLEQCPGPRHATALPWSYVSQHAKVAYWGNRSMVEMLWPDGKVSLWSTQPPVALGHIPRPCSVLLFFHGYFFSLIPGFPGMKFRSCAANVHVGKIFPFTVFLQHLILL